MPLSSPDNPLELPASTDVLIVGGGPAGLTAAIALRQRGIDCVVVEARPPAIDKACGEGLMPDALDILAELGIALSASDGHPFSGIRFANPAHSVAAHFPSGPGLGIRRPHLHSLLAARAQALGTNLMFESRVQLPTIPSTTTAMENTALINGCPIRYRWLIGADGQASTVRRHASLDRMRKHSIRYGFRTHYRADTANFTMVEVHWGAAGQLYLTPVAPDCICVVYLSSDSHRDRFNLAADFPDAARRLAGPNGLQSITAQRGAASITCRLRRVTTGHTALIGDASGSADSITGEGLAVSFRQSLALADAIASGSLASYERAHRRIARLPHTMGSLMLALDRSPRLQLHAMRALATAPALFHELLQAHVGTRSLASVFLRRAPQFSWNLIAAGRTA